MKKEKEKTNSCCDEEAAVVERARRKKSTDCMCERGCTAPGPGPSVFLFEGSLSSVASELVLAFPFCELSTWRTSSNLEADSIRITRSVVSTFTPAHGQVKCMRLPNTNTTLFFSIIKFQNTRFQVPTTAVLVHLRGPRKQVDLYEIK